MSAFHVTLCEAIAALALADPRHLRFGARRHRYAIEPPLSDVAIGAIEQRLGAALPDDYRAYLALVGDGGAGPHHGIVSLASVAAQVGDSAAPIAIPVCDLGCGYVAALHLHGAQRGQIWIDVAGRRVQAHPSFTAMLLDWIDRGARAELPRVFAEPGECALPHALSGYFAAVEARLGLDPGALAGEALREALGDLGPGAIAIAAQTTTALFREGAPVAPCVACAILIDNLVGQGLDPEAIAKPS